MSDQIHHSKIPTGDPNPDVTTPNNSGELIIPWKSLIKWPPGYVYPMGLTVTQHPTHSPAMTMNQLVSSKVVTSAWKTVSTPKLKTFHRDIQRAVVDQGGRFKIDKNVLKIYSPTGGFTSTHLPHSSSDEMTYRNVIKDLKRIGLGDHWLIQQWENKYRPNRSKSPKSPLTLREHFVNDHDITHDDLIEFTDDDLSDLHSTFSECSFKTSAFKKHAPYGIPKEKGGDSPTNVERMEKCVNKLMEEGHDKSSAIAICKSSLGFTKDKAKKKSSWKSITAHWDPDDDDDDDLDDNWDIDEDDWLDDEEGDDNNPPIPSTPTVINPSGYNEKDDPLVAFVNASTLLNDHEVELIQRACQKQVDDDFGPSWHLGMRSIFVKKGDTIPYNAWQIIFLDKATIAGALGYHDFINGQPIGYIFINTSQQAGVSPSSVASHEILEMLGDPLINTTAQVGNQTFYALESCDAVQQSSYTINVSLNNVNYPIEVSNFVTPDWFRTQTNGPWDFLRKLSGPLELLPNGSYIGVWTPRTGWVQKNAFGDIKPISDEDKRYLGDDEKGTVVHHAPQEPQRCLRPFQRRQMDKPFEITSSWRMISNVVSAEKTRKKKKEGGNCYEVAGIYLMNNFHKDPTMKLVHGTVTSNKELGDFGHAWIEIGNKVIDNSNLPDWAVALGKDFVYDKDWYYNKGGIVDTVLYDFPKMSQNALSTGHWGPWHATNARHAWKHTLKIVSMPNDHEFLQNVKFKIDKNKWSTTIEAFHDNYPSRIGSIEWFKDSGEVYYIRTHPKVRRKGLATLLWNKARSIDPNINHSSTLTEGGYEWLKSLEDQDSKDFYKWLQEPGRELNLPSIEATMNKKNWKSITSAKEAPKDFSESGQFSLLEDPQVTLDNEKKKQELEALTQDRMQMDRVRAGFITNPYNANKIPYQTGCDAWSSLECEHGTKVAPNHSMLFVKGRNGTPYEGLKAYIHRGSDCEENYFRGVLRQFGPR